MSWVKLDGVDMTTYGMFVPEQNWDLLPRPRVYTQAISQGDGGVSQGSYYESLDIKFAFFIEELTDGGLNTQLNAIKSVLKRFQAGEKSIEFELFSGKKWYGKLVSTFRVTLCINGASGELQFVAPDPWAESTTATESTDALSGDTAVVVDASDSVFDVDPVYTVKNTGGSATGSITVRNTTTGQLCTYAAGIGAGHWLRLTRSTQKAELSTNSGSSWTDVTAGLSGTVPSIEGGASNSITVYGVTTGTLDITYYPRT